MTETVLVLVEQEIEAGPPMIHLRIGDSRVALCGYRFPDSRDGQDHDHPASENDCHICQEIAESLSQ